MTTTNQNAPQTHNQSVALRKLPKRAALPFATMATSALALASGLMLGFAVPGLIGSGSAIDLIKSVLLAGAGTLVAFGVNRLAIEKGAWQAAIGMSGAAAVSVCSMLFVGAGLFAATYAGLTMDSVRDLQARDYGQAMAVYVDERSRRAAQAARIAPVMHAIVDDLAAKEECERQVSCLSGHPKGGTGPVTRALSEKRQRAESIAAQVGSGEAARREANAKLNRLLARYQEILDDPEIDGTQRRTLLRANSTETGQQLSTLDEAVPSALVAAYAGELQAPVVIADKREASQKIGALLAGYADNINTVIASAQHGDEARPVFPGATGVADTFSYLGHFLPIAAIVAVVELVFPITLWLYTYFALSGRVLREQQPGDGQDKRSRFSEMVSLNPVGTKSDTNGARPPRPPRGER